MSKAELAGIMGSQLLVRWVVWSSLAVNPIKIHTCLPWYYNNSLEVRSRIRGDKFNSALPSLWLAFVISTYMRTHVHVVYSFGLPLATGTAAYLSIGMFLHIIVCY